LKKLPFLSKLKAEIHNIRLKTARPREIGTTIRAVVRNTRETEPRIKNAAILNTN
jgi:hypothetical protein